MPHSVVAVVQQGTKILPPGVANEFEVEPFELAQHALARIRARSFDLAVVEADLPDMSGITLLGILRETDSGRNLPVIFLSPRKTPEAVAEAFGLGADDFLQTPHDPLELLARARAVLRRRFERMENRGGALSVAGIAIDPGQRRCFVDGKRLHLRPLEFDLLESFMRRAGRVLTRRYLLSSVWKVSESADSRAVDAMVSRLRRSLGKRAGGLIETVSKLGYCFIDPDLG